jgi:hypothetical protein
MRNMSTPGIRHVGKNLYSLMHLAFQPSKRSCGDGTWHVLILGHMVQRKDESD